mmetsp:Transcript_73362/g.203635  ORF Transcript_73362/g.203635 Transcript_73362/m.203635 type:complete len:474 (+) Transcript_73362:66-1487(+)
MLFDKNFSFVGRATGESLIALRASLVTGSDPAYDYSRIAADSQRGLKQTTSYGSPTSMDPGLKLLRKELKKVVGDTSSVCDQEDEAMIQPTFLHAKSAAIVRERNEREERRPSSTFKALGRAKREQLLAGERGQAPPIRTCTSDPSIARSCTPGLVGFDAPKNPVPRRSDSTSELPNGEQLDPRKNREKCLVDLAKTAPRKDFYGCVSSNERLPMGRVLESDLKSSKRIRSPCWSFSSVSKVPPTTETYSEPGEYDVNSDRLRPRSGGGNVSFAKQLPRRPMSAPSSSCPRELSSSGGSAPSRHVPTPNFTKATSRQPFPCATVGEDQVEVTDLAEAPAKPERHRPQSAVCFGKTLSRDEHYKGLRKYGEDVDVHRMHEYVQNGPVSVEFTSDIGDGPQLRPHVATPHFKHMLGRSAGVLPRHRRPARSGRQCALKFERAARVGDGRCILRNLSDVAGGVVELRASRRYEPLE